MIAAGFERWEEGAGPTTKAGDLASTIFSTPETVDIFADATGSEEELDLGDDDFDVPSFLRWRRGRAGACWRSGGGSSAGGDSARVRVIGVTKGFGSEAVGVAREAGLTDLGENYAAELVAKAATQADDAGVVWHFLGAVQRNKVAQLAPLVGVWQSVAQRGRGGADRSVRGRGAGVGAGRDDGPARPKWMYSGGDG